MTDTKPNAELAYRTLDLIEAHRAHFDMISWVDKDGSFDKDDTVGLAELTTECGTTACFAGWAAVLAGYRLNNMGRAVRDGKAAEVGEVAASLLGIDAETAHSLFFRTEGNGIEKAVDTIFGPRPVIAA